MHIVTHFLKHNRDISPNLVGGMQEVGAWWRLMAALEENVDDGLQFHLLHTMPSWSLPGLCYSFSLFL